eukprot:6205774-Pleurochrysis_carterae.AAC.7
MQDDSACGIHVQRGRRCRVLWYVHEVIANTHLTFRQPLTLVADQKSSCTTEGMLCYRLRVWRNLNATNAGSVAVPQVLSAIGQSMEVYKLHVRRAAHGSMRCQPVAAPHNTVRKYV